MLAGAHAPEVEARCHAGRPAHQELRDVALVVERRRVGNLDRVAERLERAAASAAATQSGVRLDWPPGGSDQAHAQAARVGADLLGVGARLGRREVRLAGRRPVRDELEHRRRVAHRARHHQLGHQPADEVAQRRHRHPRRDGFRPDEPAARGRDADRAAAVVGVPIETIPEATAAAEPPLDPPASGRCSTGCATARRRRLGRRQDAELGRVGLADEHEAGRAEAATPARSPRRRGSRGRVRKRMPSWCGVPGPRRRGP